MGYFMVDMQASHYDQKLLRKEFNQMKTRMSLVMKILNVETKQLSSLVRGTTSLWFFISSMEIRRQEIARDLCEQPYLSTLFINLFPPDIPCQQTFPAPQESLKGRAYGPRTERLEKKFWSHSIGLCTMASSFAQIQTGWASHFRTTSNKDSFKFQFQCQVWLPFWCTWSQSWKL